MYSISVRYLSSVSSLAELDQSKKQITSGPVLAFIPICYELTTIILKKVKHDLLGRLHLYDHFKNMLCEREK